MSLSDDNNIVSVDDPREITILFKGKLQFQHFAQQDSIYVLIVLHTHKKDRIIKIVSYSFSLHVEARRLFINYDNMNAIIDQAEVQKRFQSAISTAEKLNPNAFRNVSVGKFLKTATHETMVAYLLDHLVLSDYNQAERRYTLSILSDKGGYEESDSSDADALEVTTTRPLGIPTLLWTPPVPINSRSDQLQDNIGDTTPSTPSPDTAGPLSALFGWLKMSTPSNRIQPAEALCCTCSSSEPDVSKAASGGGWWTNKPKFSFLRTSTAGATLTTTYGPSNGSMKTIDVTEEEAYTRVRAYSTATANTNNTGSIIDVNPLPEPNVEFKAQLQA